MLPEGSSQRSGLRLVARKGEPAQGSRRPSGPGELALAGEGDAREPPAAEAERLPDQHQPGRSHPLEIGLQVRPPPPGRRRAVELGERLAVGVHHPGASSPGTPVEKAEDGGEVHAEAQAAVRMSGSPRRMTIVCW